MSNTLYPAARELASAEPWELWEVPKRSSTGAKQVKRRQSRGPKEREPWRMKPQLKVPQHVSPECILRAQRANLKRIVSSLNIVIHWPHE